MSKALVALGEEGLVEIGLLNRDPRTVERKKPGQKKARKKFTWYETTLPWKCFILCIIL